MNAISRTIGILILTTVINTAHTAPTEAESPKPVKNIFWSGHSLLAPPIPDFLEAISNGFGVRMGWNLHMMAGASLEARTRGRPPELTGWPGYRQGDNRAGQNMDVIAEFRNPQTLESGRYDVLVITEVHDFLYWLLRNDTVRLLRHYHERFIEGNAAGQTFFYQAWLDYLDKENPQTWMDYERAAAPVWQCIATRVNTSLTAEGRTDQLKFLPASLALVELVDRATSGTGLPGITAGTVGATMERIFRDKVHLSELGSYYIALVSYAFIYGKSPEGAWVPAGIDEVQAATLQNLAWAFYSDYQATNKALSLADCRALVRDSFADTYWRYIQERERSADVPWHKALQQRATGDARRIDNTRQWVQGFAEDAPDNPLRFDPDSDADYWFPAP
jgi:hypothetical protein